MMKILENTTQKLIFEHRPQTYLALHVIIEIAILLLFFYFGIIEISIWIFIPINLLTFSYLISRVKFTICLIEKNKNTISLRNKNIFNQISTRKANIDDIKKVNLFRYRSRGNSVYEIVLICKKNKIFSLTSNAIFSRENAIHMALQISDFLELNPPDEVEKNNPNKIGLIIVFSFLSSPVLYSFLYPGKSLINAVDRGDIVSVRKYIDGGGDPNISNLFGSNALFFAVDKGHKDIVELLLEKGAKTNVSCMGSTPLHQAVAIKDLDIVKMLVEHGADINALTKGNKRDKPQTPLDYAMIGNNSYVASYLKEHGAVYSVVLLHKKSVN